MKVLLINGSLRKNGCTNVALSEVGKTLMAEGIDVEMLHLGAKAVRDCVACGKCSELNRCVFDDDIVNSVIEKAKTADGFIFGSPVYFAHPSGQIQSVLNRVFFAATDNFSHKPAAAVVSARRAGTTAALDSLNKYFAYSQMPVVSSTYWNMVHGLTPEDVLHDAEGLQTMRNLGRNMAYVLKCLDIAKSHGIKPPVAETDSSTNFIR